MLGAWKKSAVHPYRGMARRLFTDQADIPCTKRDVPLGTRRVTRTVSYVLQITTCAANLGTLCVFFLLWTTASIFLVV